jgi:hypothetical protein
MKQAIHTTLIKIMFVSAVVGVLATFASAQHGYRVTKRVTFKKGEVGTAVFGTIPNTLESHEYILKARKGQVLFVKLHSAQARLGFYIMRPSGSMLDEEPFLREFSHELEESGEYHIFVYTEKGAGKYRLYIQAATDI